MIHLLDNMSHHSMDIVCYRCDVCGYEGKIRYDHFKNNVGCSVCDGKTVVEGINDLWTKRPDVATYLENREDGYKVSPFSHKNLSFRCHVCGNTETMRVASVSEHGFHCRVCNNMVSYPNRAVSSVLVEAGIGFEREKCFAWSGKRRYDFYIEPSIIVEVHGDQHYRGFRGKKFKSYDEIHKRDIEKEQDALNNGIEHYIVINARKSEFGYIRKQIEVSRLAELFDLSNIDWMKAEQSAIDGAMGDIIQKYLDGQAMQDIAKELHISEYIVRSCVKLGDSKGLCKYDQKNARLRCQEAAAKSRRKRIVCTNTGEEFDSLKDAASYYGINPKSLSNCLVGRSKSCGVSDGAKLKWNYI